MRAALTASVLFLAQQAGHGSAQVSLGTQAGPSLTIAWPRNNSWVPSWDATKVEIDIKEVPEENDGRLLLCFRLFLVYRGELFRGTDKSCQPVSDAAASPLYLNELPFGNWMSLIATLERAPVADLVQYEHHRNVIAESRVDFLSAYSPEDPAGDQILKFDQATATQDVGASCEHDYCKDNNMSEQRAAYFDQVYRYYIWAKSVTVPSVPSGPGSTLEFTAPIRGALEEVIRNFNITSILDVPCGDMTWMEAVDLQGCQYTGADISSVVLEWNTAKHALAGYKFTKLDLAEGPIPPGFDLVFVRALMYHQPPKVNLAVLKNLQRSGARYVMLTTHLVGDQNLDDFVLYLGHRINLFQPPYCLQDPFRLYQDGHSNLYMGLWEVSRLFPVAASSCEW